MAGKTDLLGGRRQQSLVRGGMGVMARDAVPSLDRGVKVGLFDEIGVVAAQAKVLLGSAF